MDTVPCMYVSLQANLPETASVEYAIVWDLLLRRAVVHEARRTVDIPDDLVDLAIGFVTSGVEVRDAMELARAAVGGVPRDAVDLATALVRDGTNTASEALEVARAVFA